jgi:sugar phosphate isomerase/epimerase
MEAIETCSGHILTTHLHDNRGSRDEHLIPGDGTIDWEGVLLAFQKVGYEGTWMFELAPSTDPAGVLARAARRRDSFDRLLRFEQ